VNLVVGDGWIEVVESPDVSAHVVARRLGGSAVRGFGERGTGNGRTGERENGEQADVPTVVTILTVLTVVTVRPSARPPRDA
jgi:hypothetical protein